MFFVALTGSDVWLERERVAWQVVWMGMVVREVARHGGGVVRRSEERVFVVELRYERFHWEEAATVVCAHERSREGW